MKTAKLFCLICGIILLSSVSKAYSQSIQWADSLIFQYNHYSGREFSGKELLGPPNATPYGRLSKNAFRLVSDQAYGTVTVGYSNPIHVSQIAIIENFLPNRIAKVILIDTEGKEHIIYRPDNKLINIPSRALAINIEKTSYKVKAVSLHLNTINKPGFAQIDAIGISSKQHSESVINSLIKTDDFDFDVAINFESEKELLDRNINSNYAEAKPIISPDGNTLYFVRKNSPQNIGGKRDMQDIYYSTKINGRWSVAQNIGRPLNDEFPNGICSISADGNTLWLINAYDEENGIIQDGISTTTRQDDGTWSLPRKQYIENFFNYNIFQDFYVSPSGNTMIMAIETQESLGNQDLYVSFRKNDTTWTEPKNMGRVLNTESIEYAPSLSHDERILYFSSNGHAPEEESEIYYAKRLDNTWMNWSEPRNIGFQVNTNDWDSYFATTPNNEIAYFVSTGGIRKESDLNDLGLDIYKIKLNIEPVADELIYITGKVYDSLSKGSVYARVELSSVENNQTYQGIDMTSAKTGSYDLKISDRGDYLMVVEADGYLPFEKRITIPEELDKKEFEVHVPLNPLAKDFKYVLEDLYFEQSKASILEGSEETLENLYLLLTTYPTLKIELGGYTEKEGYSLSNIKLSKRRAESVKKFLVDKGINKGRIKTVGYGSIDPITTSEDEDERAKNRRVEVKILDI